MTDGQTDGQTDGRGEKDRWMEGGTDGQSDTDRKRRERRTDRQRYIWKDRRMDGWTIRDLASGSTDGQSDTVRKWTDRRMNRRLDTDRKWKVGQREYKTQIDS